MKTFEDDLKSPVDEIERVWLRRGIVVILTPLAMLVGAFVGIVEGCAGWYDDCWQSINNAGYKIKYKNE